MSLIGSAISYATSYVNQQLGESYPQAIYRLFVNDKDIGALVATRLMRMTITDNRGIEADSIDIELSDHDGKLEIPPKGAEIHAWIGWSDTGLVYKGKYLIKEREHSGAPDVITIRGASADLKSTFKKKKERSFDKKTIGDIITTIAGEQGLTPKINPELAKIVLAHIDQNESDANLITRIADEHDAIATVKNGNLLFMPKGTGQTASGVSFPEFIIRRNQGDSHRFSDTDGADDISGVTCYYYDPDKAEKQKITIGQSNENTKELRNIQRDKNSALHTAQAEFNRLKSKSCTFSYNLAKGEPELIPEMQVSFLDLKPEIDDIIWLGSRVVHTLDADNGYSTSVELEVYLPDADDLSELIDDERGDYTGIVAYYKDGKNTVKVTSGDQSTPKRLTYLYKNKNTATRAAEREYRQLKGIEEPASPIQTDAAIYSGIVAYYKNGTGRLAVKVGPQSKPRTLTYLYKTQQTATIAANREYQELLALKKPKK